MREKLADRIRGRVPHPSKKVQHVLVSVKDLEQWATEVGGQWRVLDEDLEIFLQESAEGKYDNRHGCRGEKQ